MGYACIHQLAKLRLGFDFNVFDIVSDVYDLKYLLNLVVLLVLLNSELDVSADLRCILVN